MKIISQTITIAMKTRPLNTGKQTKLKAVSTSYSDAVRWYLSESKRLNTTSRSKLHNECYSVSRGMFPLQSGLLQSTLQDTLEIQRGYLTAVKKREQLNKRREKQGKKPKKLIREPVVTNLPITVRQDSWRLIKTTNGYAVKIPTTGLSKSQLVLPLIVNNHHLHYLEQIFSNQIKQAILQISVQKDSSCKVWLSLVTQIPLVIKPTEWLGVDLGIINVAVTSDGRFYGGRAIRYRKNRWYERRKALQAAGRLSKVKAERNRERDWVKDINHKISRTIVDDALASGKGIALENLRGIRSRVTDDNPDSKSRRMNHVWSFNELRQFIEYKANLAGVPLMLVDPRGTSRICSNCGCESKSNRKTQAKYVCKDCGFELNADLNAARNIVMRATINAQSVNLVGKGECNTPEGLMVSVGVSTEIQADRIFPLGEAVAL